MRGEGGGGERGVVLSKGERNETEVRGHNDFKKWRGGARSGCLKKRRVWNHLTNYR